MTRKELLKWAEETVNHLFHGHKKKIEFNGYAVRDGSGDKDIFICTEPTRDNVRKVWTCEDDSGQHYLSTLFPNITWESEPQKVKITVEIL